MNMLNISQKIRAVRLRQNMTVAQLATKSGLSKGFISRLENFRINASVKALAKVSEALGMSMSELFAEQENTIEYIFSSLNDGEKVIRDESDAYGINYYSLAFKKSDRKLEPFMLEYQPTTQARSFLMHESDEFFTLLTGELIFCIGDENNYRIMTAGDTLYLSKNIPHYAKLTDSCKLARALVIYTKAD